MISSPCTKVCVVDGASGLCFGCGRTLPEIAAWGGMSEERRKEIMLSLPTRLKKNNLSGHFAQKPSI
jgi:predicted Fe-S protein YdhL (DUF1289 family)